MTDLILLKGKMPLIKKQSKTLQSLVFHIPESVKNRLGEIPQNNLEMLDLENLPELSLVNETETVGPKLELETIKVEQLTKNIISVVLDDSYETVAVETVAAKTVVEVEVKEIVVEEIIPFFELNLENPEAVFNIGKSFLKDIADGKTNFGFTSFSKNLQEAHLLVYASFIQFSLKKPVLIITQDKDHSSFSRFKKHFTSGALLNWTSSEWGELCIVDQKQLISQSEGLSKNDMAFIKAEFSAILWSLPNGNVQGEFQKTLISILNVIDSVTFVVNKGQTKTKEIKESADYYRCFNIPLKGMLFEEKIK